MLTITLNRLYTSENTGTVSAVQINGIPFAINNIPVFALEPFDYYFRMPVIITDNDIKNAKTEAKQAGYNIAIPAGKYKIEYSFSPKFQRALPLLLGVPQFEGIRIHSFNYASQSQGCIAFGFLNYCHVENATLCTEKIISYIKEDPERIIVINNGSGIK